MTTLAEPLVGARSAAPRLTLALVVCFLVALIDGYDTLMMSFIAPLVAREFALPPPAFGKIFAAGFAGALVGALVVGTLGDRVGRKRMLLVALLLAGTFGVAGGWADGPGALMAMRFLAGLGLGGAIPVVAALVADQVPPEQRSSAVTRMFLGFPLGAVAGGALTAVAMQSAGWRGVFVASGVLTLAMAGGVGATLGEPTAASRSANPTGRLRQPLARVAADGRAPGSALLCLGVFMMLVVGYFVVSWMPTVLTQAGLSPKIAALAAVVLNLGGVAGALTLSYAVGKRDPFLAVALCLLGGAALVFIFGWSAQAGTGASFVLIFGIGALVIGGQLSGPGLAVHFYPSEVRATGGGLVMASGRLGAIVGPLLGGLLLGLHLGWNRLFMLAAIPAFAAAACTLGAYLLRPRGATRPLR